MRLIDAEALKGHKFVGNKYVQIGGRTNSKTLENINKAYQQGWNDAIDAIIDNAPTVERPTKEKEEFELEADSKIASILYSLNKVFCSDDCSLCSKAYRCNIRRKGEEQ